ncbi:SDR family oxidoreductase [Agrococcus sp. Marseille-P2731]|uniref:SDR family oxidoreductase n=1 Tax=Agrococcus sp. Marseille-P2731 TaxID=1841862 RepID=UPI000930E490|nr:SDR family oxidoreductase [Agrococcus sp. Marseille-P2731]
MTSITIIGGHGKVALLLAPLLAERGDQVSSVIRKAEQSADIEAAGATPVVADVQQLDREQLAELLRGQDAVVWSAGAGGGSAERTFAVDRDAAIRVIDAAADAGVQRFVMVSYMGAGQDHGVPEDDDFYAYAQAKADADDHLRASSLDWTILGPGMLTLEEPTEQIEVVGDGAADGEHAVSRANVARVVAATLADPSTIGRTIQFGDGRTPIAVAVTA